MSGRRLSHEEKMELAGIESALCDEPSFRVLSSEYGLVPAHGKRRRAGSWSLPAALWCAVFLSLALLVLATATSAPPLIAAFAVSYAMTSGLLVALVRQWCARHPDGPEN
ncbi:hypothetical protein [Streptomyces avidinii]|uniref:DUF3040 family protein n=1 Tax=Streptomyces avidinii TaxID=1895 RepID=A0ABS4KZX0_STRAV|nr:hypothetical protein [Streptomyces avidinii]MBP2034926.1 hypothetical protein [Streptomyces avidinii]